MSEVEESESVSMDTSQIELPPWISVALSKLDQSGKMVMRTRILDAEGKPVVDDRGRPLLKYNDPRFLREFIGLELVPQIIQLLTALSSASQYTYTLADGASVNVAGLKRWATEHFRALGARDLEKDPGLRQETVDSLGNAIYALGTHLKEKYPTDETVGTRFNAVAEAFRNLLEEVRTGGAADGEEDGDDEDEGDEDE